MQNLMYRASVTCNKIMIAVTDLLMNSHQMDEWIVQDRLTPGVAYRKVASIGLVWLCIPDMD